MKKGFARRKRYLAAFCMRINALTGGRLVRAVDRGWGGGVDALPTPHPALQHSPMQSALSCGFSRSALGHQTLTQGVLGDLDSDAPTMSVQLPQGILKLTGVRRGGVWRGARRKYRHALLPSADAHSCRHSRSRPCGSTPVQPKSPPFTH